MWFPNHRSRRKTLLGLVEFVRGTIALDWRTLAYVHCPFPSFQCFSIKSMAEKYEQCPTYIHLAWVRFPAQVHSLFLVSVGFRRNLSRLIKSILPYSQSQENYSLSYDVIANTITVEGWRRFPSNLILELHRLLYKRFPSNDESYFLLLICLTFADSLS